MLISLVFFTLLSIGSYNQAGAKLFNETEDLDSYFEASFGCFWYIFCDLGKVMEIREVIFKEANVTIDFMFQGIMEIFPRSKDLFTLENAFSKKFWADKGYDVACVSITKEEREILNDWFATKILRFYSEICNPEGDVEACEKAADTSAAYYEMVLKYEKDCLKYFAPQVPKVPGIPKLF